MKKLINTTVNIYVLLLMTAFQLFLTDKYRNVLMDKLYFYLYATIACMALIALHAIGGWITREPEKKGGKKGSFVTTPKGEAVKLPLLMRIKANLRITDYFAIAFLVITVISTACSKWPYEAFWGNMGRYQGGFLWFFYLCTYAIVSRLYMPKHWHMDVFLLVGAIVCGWGVLDYFWLSPFGWQAAAGRAEAFDFSSTIGNVNTLTALEGMYLLIAATLFVGLKKPEEGSKAGNRFMSAETLYKVRLVYYYFAAVLAFTGMSCGMSDNAVLGLGTMLCFLPFFAFRNRTGIIRYFSLLPGYLISMLIIGKLTGDKQRIYYWKWGALLNLSNNHWGLVAKLLAAAVVALILVIAVLKASAAKISDQKLGKGIRIIWGGMGVAAALTIIAVLVDANTGGHAELYAPYSKLLIFDNNWGTNRGYNWGLCIGYMKNAFNGFQRWFGAGPETYEIFTYTYDYYAMKHTTQETYDSPHNEFLQHLFSTGILGFIAYYGMVISSMAAAFRTKGYNNQLIGSAFAFAVLAYTLASIVNISVPVTVPTLIICMGGCVAVGRKDVGIL